MLLLLTGLGKLVAAIKWQVDMSIPDPLLPFLGIKQTVGGAALLELLMVIVLLIGRSDLIKSFLILWLCAVFLVYRLGLLIIGSPKMCPCLGYWGNWCHLSEPQVNGISISILTFMALGSAAVIARMRLRTESSR